MNVRVNPAGKKQRASRVDPLRRLREPGAVAENRDPAVPNPDGAPKNASGTGDGRVPDQQIENRGHISATLLPREPASDPRVCGSLRPRPGPSGREFPASLPSRGYRAA
ncbi:hypothetical protein SDC9_201229 [bioreactor metagenome]|uniref:Uncharacterized protein n=1 Tax=bioreactor metagenome TaxID=1076179 RepID=A0A645IQC8_9ZZZZ